MVEQFDFPLQLGAIEEVVSVQITPQWEQQQLEESVRLTGIYHIAASVRFDPTKEVHPGEGIFIDHLDVNNLDGYFEYALPLEVDLPKEKMETNQLALDVNDVSFFVYDGSGCTFKWQVACRFEGQPVVEEIVPEQVVKQLSNHVTEQLPEQLAILESSSQLILAPEPEKVANAHDDFYAELAEAYSLLNVTLNKVRRE